MDLSWNFLDFTATTKIQQQEKEEKSANVSSATGSIQKIKTARKEAQVTKESESKKREDLTSLGSDDSGWLTELHLLLIESQTINFSNF